MEKKSFKDAAGQFFADWKSEYENLELKAALGKQTARQKFEEQRQKFIQYIASMRNALQSNTNPAFADLRNKLQELEMQLAFAALDAAHSYADYKSKVDAKIDETLLTIKDMPASASEQLRKRATDFKQTLDIFKHQFVMEQTPNQWEEEKKEMDKKLAEIKQEMEKAKELAEKKFQEAKQVVKKHVSHWGDMINDLFDKDDDKDNKKNDDDPFEIKPL